MSFKRVYIVLLFPILIYGSGSKELSYIENSNNNNTVEYQYKQYKQNSTVEDVIKTNAHNSAYTRLEIKKIKSENLHLYNELSKMRARVNKLEFTLENIQKQSIKLHTSTSKNNSKTNKSVVEKYQLKHNTAKVFKYTGKWLSYSSTEWDDSKFVENSGFKLITYRKTIKSANTVKTKSGKVYVKFYNTNLFIPLENVVKIESSGE